MTSRANILFESLCDYPTVAPAPAHPDDVGIDLRWYPEEPSDELYNLFPNDIGMLKCGFRMQLPEGYFGMVCSRSGLAKCGISVVNSPGIIDPGYRGELAVILQNTHAVLCHSFRVGDRIAQLVIVPATQGYISLGKVSINTSRGEDGFGSTGKE